MSRIKLGLLAASVLAVSLPIFPVTIVASPAAGPAANKNDNYQLVVNNSPRVTRNDRPPTRTPPIVPRTPVSTGK
jgi:hypothetical protein